MLTVLKQRLLEKGLDIRVDPMEDFGFVYSVLDTQNSEPTQKEFAYLVITNGIDYTVNDVDQLVIHIRDLWVQEEYRHRGIGRFLLFYGLCHAIEQTPSIRYSDLEDNSDFPFDEPGNLYYAFGYRFKEGDLQEKWLDLEVFKMNIPQLFQLCLLK